MTEKLDDALDTKKRVDRPKMYRVVLLNDDFTPMDFVIRVLRDVFHMDVVSAEQVTMEVHNKGAGTAGVYTMEVAETKSIEVEVLAMASDHPLKCKVEQE